MQKEEAGHKGAGPGDAKENRQGEVRRSPAIETGIEHEGHEDRRRKGKA